MIDITLARITHMEWVYQLELALQKESVHVSITPYDKCDLGLWLYGEAIKRYNDIHEIDILEKEHRLFHFAADRVVQWHNSSKQSAKAEAQARVDFGEVKRRSKEIIFLLTMIEFKLLNLYQEIENRNAKKYKHIIGTPLRVLRRLVGGNTFQYNSAVDRSKAMLKQELKNDGYL